MGGGGGGSHARASLRTQAKTKAPVYKVAHGTRKDQVDNLQTKNKGGGLRCSVGKAVKSHKQPYTGGIRTRGEDLKALQLVDGGAHSKALEIKMGHAIGGKLGKRHHAVS